LTASLSGGILYWVGLSKIAEGEANNNMTYQFPPDVDEFVQKQLATGEYVSEDEILRDALRALDAERQEWAAIQEGLATLELGHEGVSLQEAFDAIRAKYHVPADA